MCHSEFHSQHQLALSSGNHCVAGKILLSFEPPCSSVKWGHHAHSPHSCQDQRRKRPTKSGPYLACSRSSDHGNYQLQRSPASPRYIPTKPQPLNPSQRNPLRAMTGGHPSALQPFPKISKGLNPKAYRYWPKHLTIGPFFFGKPKIGTEALTSRGDAEAQWVAVWNWDCPMLSPGHEEAAPNLQQQAQTAGCRWGYKAISFLQATALRPGPM